MGLDRYQEPIYALMRIVLGFLFMCHGSQALLGFPAGEAREMSTFILVGKAIELVGGLFLALGLFTRPTAFVCSGEMAVAYWMFHAKGGFFPVVNRGELAVVYCFVFLYIAAKGSGIWSLDRLRRRSASAS